MNETRNKNFEKMKKKIHQNCMKEFSCDVLNPSIVKIV